MPFTTASKRVKYLGINYFKRSTKFVICKVQNTTERNQRRFSQRKRFHICGLEDTIVKMAMLLDAVKSYQTPW